MPENLEKVILRQISWDSDQDVVVGDHVVTVQFNPESLKMALSNQNAGGDQRGGSSIQYVGAGTTKLSFDLWFDVTDQGETADVRELTEQVVFFMTPRETDEEDKFLPPGVRFLWGNFLFEGIMDSLNEDLEYFSEDGRALRAKLSVSISRQEIRYEKGRQQGGSGLGTSAASSNNRQAQEGDTMSDLAGENWAPAAAANGIENPLDLDPGALLDLSAGLSLEAGFSVAGGLSAGASFGAGLSAGASLGGGLRAGVAGGAGLGGGLSAGAGIGGGLSAGAGGGLSTGGGSSLGAGASFGGLGASAGASLGGGPGASADFGGAAASASASANASFNSKLRR